MDQRHSAKFLFLIWSREKMSALKYGKSRLKILIIFFHDGMKIAAITLRPKHTSSKIRCDQVLSYSYADNFARDKIKNQNSAECF